MEIFIPYVTLEEKQGIKDRYGKLYVLLREDVRAGFRFLVYDDGTPAPFTIPDEVVKAGFLVVLDYLNAMLAGTYAHKTPQDLLMDVKAKAGK